MNFFEKAYAIAHLVAPKDKYLEKLREYLDGNISLEALAEYEERADLETTRFKYSKEWDSLESHKMDTVYFAIACCLVRDGRKVLTPSDYFAESGLGFVAIKAKKAGATQKQIDKIMTQ